MKKLLALILLSPLAHSELTEYYCEGNIGASTTEYFTLKIDDDVNNPSFVIENSVDTFGVGSRNFVANTNNIKVMPLTIFVTTNEDQRFGYKFNRATAVLSRSIYGSGRYGVERFNAFNEFVKDSSSTKTEENITSDDGLYSCQPFISNKP